MYERVFLGGGVSYKLLMYVNSLVSRQQVKDCVLFITRLIIYCGRYYREPHHDLWSYSAL